jgi:hypothetical protein
VRDFLEVSASEMGSGNVSLGVGMTQTPVPVLVVDPSAVTSVAITKQSDAHASKGDTLYVFGRAGDTDGNDLFGASFAWEVNGTALPSQSLVVGGPTDLVTYQFDPSQTETVGDQLAGYSASSSVHGAPATTAQATTENVGCSVARGAVGTGGGGAAGAGAVGMGLIAAAVAGRRARRRRGGC